MTINKENVSPKSERSKVYPVIKIVFLGVIYLGSALGFAYYWSAFLREGALSYLLIAGVCAGFFAIFSVVAVFLIPGLRIISALAFLSGILILVPFFSHLEENHGLFLALSALVFFGFSFLGLKRGNDILENSLNIRFFQDAKSVISMVLTGMALFASAIFYFSYFEWGQLNEDLTKRASDEIVSSMERPLHAWFPDASTSQKTGDFLKTLVRAQVEKLAEPGQVGSKEELGLDKSTRLNIPVAEKEKIIKESASALKEELEKITGPLEEDEPIKDVVYKIAKNQISSVSQKFGTKPFFGIGVAVLIFFILQSFVFIFRLPLAALAFLIYEFLIITRFARVEFKSAVKETIVI